jgi:5'-nucleotidase
VFPLIERILSVNTAEEQPGEVVLLSRNDADTGLRAFKSIEHYRLPISRAAFVSGNNPFPYMDAFHACLFLSGNSDDVREAVAHGYPAGCIYPTEYMDQREDEELRLAFDFDGIVADDSAETVFQQSGGLGAFHRHEKEHAAEPLPPGPLLTFIKGIAKLQSRILDRSRQDPNAKAKIRVAIVTARNAPAHERVITTLRNFDIQVDDAFFVGGIDKSRVLRIYRLHIFFDDQREHIERVARIVPSVHVPFGVTNQPPASSD